MFGVSERRVRQSKDIFARRPGFVAAWALAIAMLAMIAWLPEAMAIPSTPDQNTWITDGNIYAVVTSGTTVYLGGDFTYVGPNTGYGVPIDASAGSVKSPYPKVNGQVWAVVPDGLDGWYIGGEFTQVGTFARSYIAHILSDGTVDSNWDPQADGAVYALAVSPNGTLVYAAGAFSFIGGETRTFMAALDADPGSLNFGLATSWDPCADEECDGPVNALVAFPDGTKVYVGGAFTHIGGVDRQNIAALNNSDGSAIIDFDGNATDTVYTLALSGDRSRLYVGGDFTRIGGKIRNHIAAVGSGGGAVLNWNPDADGTVGALAVSDSTVYAGGDFTSIGGQPRNYIAALNASTASATSWDPNANTDVYALVVSGSTIYAGGDFSEIGGQPRNYIAALNNSDGSAIPFWSPNASNTTYALAVSGSTVYAGGGFVSMGGKARNFIAALDATTGNPISWNPSADDSVYALAVRGSTVYAGGNFSNIGGQARNYIAALDASTGLSTSWNPNAISTVYALAVSVGGSKVYAGGDFSNIGGQDRNFIAALDAATGFATSWDPEADSTVYALAIGAGGSTVYAGGAFTSIGRQARNGIAALDDTGNATSWNPNAELDSIVYALAVSGSTIYVGGDFSNIGGQDRNYIAALDAATGLVIPSWDPAADADYVVYALAVGPSVVYAGGEFSFIGNQSRNYIAALDAATGLATSWDPEADLTVYSLALIPSNLFAGGAFTSIGGEFHPYLAQFSESYTGLPGKATLISPSGAIDTNTPTYTWNADAHSAWYYLWVTDTTGTKIQQWYKAADAGCPSGAGTCSVKPQIALAAGSAKWWIQTYNANGSGPWSDGMGFTVPAPVLPGKAVLISPSGAIDTSTPTYAWNADAHSTWYYLWVTNTTGNKIQQWYKASDAGCSTGTGICSVTPGTALAAGSAKWWIQTWSPAGSGPWSDSMAFIAPAPVVPGKAVLISPSGAINTNTPTYSWNADAHSTWYYLWVSDNTGDKIKQWYTAAQAGCSSGTGTCSATPGTALATGSARWWIDTWNPNGAGLWSDVMAFTAPAPVVPGNATLISPSGTIDTSTPTYTWDADAHATWYYLWVTDTTGNKIQQWYKAADAGCAGGTGTCSVTPQIALAAGSAKWWIQTWNPNGSGPWSDGMVFTVQ